jgi:hypothetical protein
MHILASYKKVLMRQYLKVVHCVWHWVAQLLGHSVYWVAQLLGYSVYWVAQLLGYSVYWVAELLGYSL